MLDSRRDDVEASQRDRSVDKEISTEGVIAVRWGASIVIIKNAENFQSVLGFTKKCLGFFIIIDNPGIKPDLPRVTKIDEITIIEVITAVIRGGGTTKVRT